jgi:hypothetical protein
VTKPKANQRYFDRMNLMKEGEPMEKAEKSKISRLMTLFIAFIGCVVTALPFVFFVGAEPIPFILTGSGVAVIALALFLFFSL